MQLAAFKCLEVKISRIEKEELTMTEGTLDSNSVNVVLLSDELERVRVSFFHRKWVGKGRGQCHFSPSHQ